MNTAPQREHVGAGWSVRRAVVRCTKKMLDLLGGRSVTLSELPPTNDDWYLNLV